MASSQQASTALLTEHLRYTPLTLIDDIINTINELTNRAVDAAETGLLRAGPSTLGFAARASAENRTPEKDADGNDVYPEAKSEIEEGVHQLETLLESNIDKNFDKFEIVALRGILSVPPQLVPYIRLEHYNGIPETSQLENLPSTESLLLLQQRVQETRKLQRALRATATKNEAILNQLRSMTAADGPNGPGPLAFLLHNGSAGKLGISSNLKDAKSGPLTTNVSFALSQLPALQQLLAQLRPNMPTTNQSVDDPASEGAIARERRIYVEAQSRRALERQGLASGTDASETLGRIPNMEEVVALEDMVQDND